jgi:hypothetical protein
LVENFRCIFKETIMERNGFGVHSTGDLVPTIGGRTAFVPYPLPPAHLDLNPVAFIHAVLSFGASDSSESRITLATAAGQLVL